MTAPQNLPRPLPRWLPLCVVLVAIAAFAGWTVRGIVSNPGFTFLLPRDGAQWIRPPIDTTIVSFNRAPLRGVFADQFRLDAPLTGSSFYVMGFRSLRVYLDQKLLFEDPPLLEAWKFERHISVPGTLAPGEHVLTIACSNDLGPPMIRVRWPDANLRSGLDWSYVRTDNVTAVYGVSGFPPPAYALEFPSIRESFLGLFPAIVAVFLVVAALWTASRRFNASKIADIWLSPSRLRWFLLAAFLIVGINNMFRLRMTVGTDLPAHYGYIHYIAEHRALPPIDYNLQAFEAPLFYVIAAFVHQVLLVFTNDAAADRLLRILPIFCGLGILEIVYRFALRAFPRNESSQRVALLLGTFFPMALAKTQVVTNEPLAGFLVAAASLAVIDLTTAQPDSRRPWRFAAAGIFWGLAVITKVSAVVLVAPAALGLAWWVYAWPGEHRPKALRLSLFVAATALTCGWFFIRSQLLYGKPIVGGWDAESGYEWWQFPGFRTLEQYTTFGAALSRPVFSLVYGAWDGLYAGLWFDAETSGTTGRQFGPTWNFSYALAALPWAIPPTIALFVGATRALWPRAERSPDQQDALVVRAFALMVAGAYLAAILGHSLAVPFYNTIKATYALGAVPSIVVLVVAGAEPLLQRRWTRGLVYAWLAVWILLVGVGYWALPPD